MKQFNSYKEFLAAILSKDPDAHDAVDACNEYSDKKGNECSNCPIAKYIQCPAMYD